MQVLEIVVHLAATCFPETSCLVSIRYFFIFVFYLFVFFLGGG